MDQQRHDSYAAIAIAIFALTNLLAGCGGGGGRPPPGAEDPDDGSFTYFRSFDVRDAALRVRHATPTRDGGALLVGGVTREALVIDRFDAARQYATSLAAIRTDASGAQLWATEIGGSVGDYAFVRLTGAARTADGGYLLAGQGDVGTSVARVDAAGEFLWQRSYPGELRRHIRGIVAMEDGGAIVAGSITRLGGENTRSWLWIAKLDSLGRIERERTDLERIAPAVSLRLLNDTVYTVDFASDLVELDLSFNVLTDASYDSRGASGVDAIRFERGPMSPAPGFFVITNYGQAYAAERFSGEIFWEDYDQRIDGDYDAIVLDANQNDVLAVAHSYSYSNSIAAITLRTFRRTAPDEFDITDMPLPALNLDAGSGEPYKVEGMVRTRDGRHLLAGVMKNGRRWYGLLGSAPREFLWVRLAPAENTGAGWIVGPPVQTDDDRDGVADDGFLVTYENGAIKLDARGGLELSLPARRLRNSEVGLEAVETADGGFIVAAQSSVLRLEADGRLRWRRAGADLNSIESAVQTRDGGIALLASDSSSVVKMNASGEIVWQQTGLSDCLRCLEKMFPTADGGVLIWSKNQLIKLDQDGALDWSRLAPSNADQYSLTQTNDGDFVITGRVSVGPGALSGAPEGVTPGQYPWLARTDRRGQVRWSRAYLAPGFAQDLSPLNRTALALASDGVTLAMTGIGAAPSAAARCPFDLESGSYSVRGCADMVLLTVDAEGRPRWMRSYGTATSDFITSIARMADNGFLVAGETNGIGFPRFGAALLRTDADGNVAPIVTGSDGNPISSCAVSLGARLPSPYVVDLPMQFPEVHVPSARPARHVLTPSEDIRSGSLVTEQFRSCLNESQAPVLRLSVSGPGAVSSSPAGIDCGADCEQSFATFTSVTLTATPNAGARFTGWGGQCTNLGTTNTITFELTSDRTCTAAFNTTSGGGNAPTAVFFAYDEYGPGRELASGDPIVFDPAPSFDDGAIVRYEWDMDGDGVFEVVRTGPDRQMRVYSAPGNYMVRLQLTDNDGLQNIFNGAFTIAAPPTPDNGYTLSIAPTSVNVAAGSVATAQIDAARATFSGDLVRLYISDCPQSAICTLSSDRIAFSNYAPITLTIDARNLQAGSSAPVTVSSYGPRGLVSSAVGHVTVLLTVR